MVTMTLRKILTEPDPILRQISSPIEGEVTDEHRLLMDDMLETMYDAEGIGLAAIQIGVPKRIIVVDLVVDETLPPTPLYFVNPVITIINPEMSFYKEGCLSVPEITENIARPSVISVDYLDYHGHKQNLQTDGLLATCLQHEMDHLNGILFIDKLPRLKRQLILQKMIKRKKLKLV